jgi:hypothetical protein
MWGGRGRRYFLSFSSFVRIIFEWILLRLEYGIARVRIIAP